MKSFVFLYFFVALSPIVTCQNSHRSFGRCPKFTIKKSTIIKSSQSLHNGAVLLGRKVTHSSAGCHKECCKNTDCNLVMLKYELQNKIVKITCFLFDCKTPSVCSFYQHSTYHNYVALDYGERKSSFKAHDYHPRNKGMTVATTIHSQSVTARNSSVVEHTWAERTFTETPTYKKPTDKDISYDIPMKKQTRQKFGFDKQSLNERSTTHSSFDSGTTNDNKNNEESYERPSDEDSSVREQTTETKEEEMDEEEEFPRRVFVDNNPDFPEKPASHMSDMKKSHDIEGVKTTGSIHTQTTADLNNQEHTNEKTEKWTFTSTESDNRPTTQAYVSTKPQVNQFVVRKFISVQDNKAVIPLAVGLVLALLLLMGVIFRLKASKRRRTKAFLTDDADYLINGMYL
ncbi:uncharacterized protein LOC124453164 isoform X2 [Xenia sp. Carnegie-2017]|uniref:uncharacterized protein LOC124453164 isoform X2 n=1 Tax=Xenia sp. Carnegie-2017 TaxID=2897299 RepID=UPI001F04B98C|nr:uncharacterized protein LOC124453164 isoform X2 [Xenia sp. Carnegie-2017]